MDILSVTATSSTFYDTEYLTHWPPFVETSFELATFDAEKQLSKVIFNDPATVLFWKDGSKTVVKCMEGEEFDPYYGFCAAVCKKIFGGSNSVRKAAGIPKQKKRKDGDDN